AQNTIHTISPAVTVSTSPMRAQILPGSELEARGEVAHELANCRGGVLALARRAHEARADDHAIGAGVGGRASVVGCRDPEADGDGHGGARLRARDDVAQVRLHRRALAG